MILSQSRYDNGTEFARDVAKFCYEHYARVLSKTGKPQKHCEWTLLAAIIETSVISEGAGFFL